jgi:hypothetical protein
VQNSPDEREGCFYRVSHERAARTAGHQSAANGNVAACDTFDGRRGAGDKLQSMTLLPTTNTMILDQAEDGPPIELRGFSYDEQRRIVPALLDAMANCGCWVQEQRALSLTQTELRFEVHVRSAFELYSELIGAGVELTRDSHVRMTGLCTLRGHNPRQARRRRVVSMRLEVSFLEENNFEFGMMAIGLA